MSLTERVSAWVNDRLFVVMDFDLINEFHKRFGGTVEVTETGCVFRAREGDETVEIAVEHSQMSPFEVTRCECWLLEHVLPKPKREKISVLSIGNRKKVYGVHPIEDHKVVFVGS